MAPRTVTVKSADGNYTTLNAALAGEVSSYADLVTNTMILTIECYSSTGANGADTTAALTGTGWTTSALYYINITVPAANRHAGAWDTSKYHHVLSTGTNIAVQEEYTRITGVQAEATGGTGNGIQCGTGGNYSLVDRCIVRTVGRYGMLTSAVNCTVRNSIVYGGFVRDGISLGGGCVAVNCTAYGGNGTSSYGGIRVTAGSVEIANCVSGGHTNTVGFFFAAGPGQFLNNASSDGTADDQDNGTTRKDNIANVTITDCFTDAANGNFTVKSATAPICDVGVESFAPSYAPYTLEGYDIAGTARDANYDIGAFEYVAGGGGGGSAVIYNPYDEVII